MFLKEKYGVAYKAYLYPVIAYISQTWEINGEKVLRSNLRNVIYFYLNNNLISAAHEY